MKHGRLRLRFVVPFTLLFLAIALEPVPSERAAADLRMVSAKRPAAQGPLAGSVTAPWSPVGSLRAFHLSDLDAAASPQRRRFGIFPAAVSAERQRRFLHELPYGRAMAAAAERHRVDGLLVAAIVEAESGFNPGRVSSRGAIGLMQVLPSTAGELGATGDQDLRDPSVNLDVGSRYLGQLIDDFSGDVKLAVAAYNAGPGAVERYRGVPPYPETRKYVEHVLSLYGAHSQTASATPEPLTAPEPDLSR
jgi:soluble lytic murein transglycosylase-like protein